VKLAPFGPVRVIVPPCPGVRVSVPVLVALLKPVTVRVSVIVPLLTLLLNVLVAVCPFGRVAVMVRPKFPPPLLYGVKDRL
jgi:hypothetical protein